MFLFILLDADCSGRMLATLLVVWVTTAMVASILLRWEYMWIVLAIMTLLLFLICGYTAYNVKKAHTRILIEEQRRAAVRTISALAAANCRETETSARINVDLPPSYASVVSPQATSTSSPTIDHQPSTTIDRIGEDKFENPPPYSIVIASLNKRDQNTEGSNESNVSPSEATKRNDSAAAVAATSASVSLTCLHER